MTSIAARRALTSDGWTGRCTIEVVDGVIAAIADAPNEATATLVPGFVDLQVNGIDDIDAAHADGADWEHLDALLLAQGTTTWCPTLVTMPLDRYAAPLRRVEAAMRRTASGRPAIAGVHLEGPFLGSAPGAHDPAWIVPVDQAWLDGLPPCVAVVTLGPEQVGATAAIASLAERGVVASIGHTRASAEEFGRAIDAGARLVTHLFNAMSGVHHRDPGVAAFTLAHPRIGASLIADGVHVDPVVLRLAFAALRPDRAVLVTDAVAWRAGTAGDVRVELRDGAPRLLDGTLAGSALTMDAAIRTCVNAGVALADAVRAASTNPARLLGLADRGEIRVGARADLLALSPDLAVERVWIAGRESFNA